MNAKYRADAALRQLKKANRRIRDEFARMDDSLVRTLLANEYSTQLSEHLKKHGDGQRLYSYPRSINSLEACDAVVLIAMTTPKLSSSSNFDRSTPLHRIDHWRTSKPIQPNLDSHRLHFMAWQQSAGVHGVDDKHAFANYRLLTSENHRLRLAFDEEKESGANFLLALEEWFTDTGRTTIVITNSIRKNFHEPILSLIHNPNVSHIKTGLRGGNTKIMGLIEDIL